MMKNTHTKSAKELISKKMKKAWRRANRQIANGERTSWRNLRKPRRAA